MQVNCYYIKATKLWCAYLTNEAGNQIGNAQFALTKELAQFWVVSEIRQPVRFIDQLLPSEET